MEDHLINGSTYSTINVNDSLNLEYTQKLSREEKMKKKFKRHNSYMAQQSIFPIDTLTSKKSGMDPDDSMGAWAPKSLWHGQQMTQEEIDRYHNIMVPDDAMTNGDAKSDDIDCIQRGELVLKNR